MKKLEIDIEQTVYEESLKFFKTKENLELFISSTLIKYKELNDLKIIRYATIKEFKDIIDYIIDGKWLNVSDINSHVENNTFINNKYIKLRLKDLRTNSLGNIFYTFVPYYKENPSSELIKITIEIEKEELVRVVIKDINFLEANRPFNITYENISNLEKLDLESIKYQLYLSLSYIYKVDINEI